MKLEISVNAWNFPNDGKLNAFAVVVVTTTTSPEATHQVLGNTEFLNTKASLNWIKTFTFDYALGEPMQLVISVYNLEGDRTVKPLGSATFDVDEFLGIKGNLKTKQLANGGIVCVSIRKGDSIGSLQLQMRGVKLKDVEWFSVSNPFFEIKRKIETDNGVRWLSVYRSDTVTNKLNPIWKTVIIELNTLCGGDLDTPNTIFDVYSFASNGNHKPIGGSRLLSIHDMKSLVNDCLPITSNNKQCGNLCITHCDINQYHFVDYIRGGCELNVVVAIDFTQSNGDPTIPGTLHHIGGDSWNDYQEAISSVVQILAKYDSDKIIPVYGFGAEIDGVVQHCFPMGSTTTTSGGVLGVAGVLEEYRQLSGRIKLSGPKRLDKVIDQAAHHAKEYYSITESKGKQSYTILLIVTNNAATDLSRTTEAINRALDVPLSVVIVGVGDGNFGAMSYFDDDNCSIFQRDIVQFVEFNQYKKDLDTLKKITLQEIPTQLASYFKRNGIAPLPPIQRNLVDDDILEFWPKMGDDKKSVTSSTCIASTLSTAPPKVSKSTERASEILTEAALTVAVDTVIKTIIGG